MKEQRILSSTEREMVELIMDYLDRHAEADRADGAAAYMLCRGDENAAKLIVFLKENPDVDSYGLFVAAAKIAKIDFPEDVEISDNVKND